VPLNYTLKNRKFYHNKNKKEQSENKKEFLEIQNIMAKKKKKSQKPPKQLNRSRERWNGLALKKIMIYKPTKELS
jgi:hypothetical protein